MTLHELNSSDTQQLIGTLMLCCGSTNWAQYIAESRPYANLDALIKKSDAVWNSLSESDWQEAFTHHPKIGDIESLRKKFASTAVWAEGEQSGTAMATDDVLKKLAALNDEYQKKYGYIFIVCATGKSAEEMLAILESRLENEPDDEIRIAAGEQQKITNIRLKKLLA